MKNMKSNVGSFAQAKNAEGFFSTKLQAKMRSILAIIVLVAVIGFSMATLSLTSCDDNNNNNNTSASLAGTTWKNTKDGITTTLTFTASTFTLDLGDFGVGLDTRMYGTYTFNGSSGTLTHNVDGSSDPFVVNGNTLTIVAPDPNQNLLFTKSGSGGTPTTPITPTYSLDGVWMNSSGRQISVSGNTGIILDIGTTSGIGIDAVNKGYVKVGNPYWKEIKSTGTLTWSCQLLQVLFNTSSPNVAIGTGWTNCTITMNSNGQTINDGGTVWTRQ